jgi:ketosteroid isomerase-like protein
VFLVGEKIHTKIDNVLAVYVDTIRTEVSGDMAFITFLQKLPISEDDTDSQDMAVLCRVVMKKDLLEAYIADQGKALADYNAQSE